MTKRARDELARQKCRSCRSVFRRSIVWPRIHQLVGNQCTLDKLGRCDPVTFHHALELREGRCCGATREGMWSEWNGGRHWQFPFSWFGRFEARHLREAGFQLGPYWYGQTFFEAGKRCGTAGDEIFEIAEIEVFVLHFGGPVFDGL